MPGQAILAIVGTVAVVCAVFAFGMYVDAAATPYDRLNHPTETQLLRTQLRHQFYFTNGLAFTGLALLSAIGFYLAALQPKPTPKPPKRKPPKKIPPPPSP